MEDVNPVSGGCPDYSKPLNNPIECMRWFFLKMGRACNVSCRFNIKHSQTKDENLEGEKGVLALELLLGK